MSLFVATPLYNGQVSHMYLRGALDAQRSFPDVHFSVAVGTYLSLNRETLTKRFEESEVSHLLFVDSDIGWTAEVVKNLLAAHVDLISATYLQRNGEPIIPAEPLGSVDDRHPDLIECFSVPAGCLLIRRDVILRMRRAFTDQPLWSMGYDRGDTIGEDVHFCRKWRELRGKVWLHPNAIVDHIGEVVFRPNAVPSPVRFKSGEKA